ncbi:MAG TPA: GNAT family N-acetyltransferase [Acidimicrobiales bacterium]|nr:GNAT family N-acetyltransferase [Acidimicrobiales bacterium]
MTRPTDDDLYRRGAATLVASWQEYAHSSPGAAVVRTTGVSAAVFPHEPERSVYNNAVLDRDLGPVERTAAVDALDATYRSHGIDHYAAWVHESDTAMRAELDRRGYIVDESTRAMGMPLDDIAVRLPDAELGPIGWPDYLAHLTTAGAPAGLLSGADPSAFHVLGARHAGQNATTALAFDHDGDCGIFNMSTLEGARRQGLGRALLARLVHDAQARGCSTATLQSTPMAERLYARAGFRDLGRFLEHSPKHGPTRPDDRDGQ